MDTYNFIAYIKTVNIYIDIAYDVEKIFNTPNYIFDRSIGKNKKVIWLMEDKIGGKIITKFVELWPKTYSHLVDDSSCNKKPKGTKKRVRKRKPKLKDYKKYFTE